MCCVDVDECLVANGGCDHTCQNTAGSFQCFCRQGFRLDEDRRSCERELHQSNEMLLHHTPCGHPGNLLLSLSVCLSLSLSLSYSAALGNTVEALSSGSQDIVGTLAQPQLALLQDYNQPLERYDDYEDDDAGELLAESMLAEKFGEPLNTNTHTMVLYLISSVSEQQEVNRKTSLFNY